MFVGPGEGPFAMAEQFAFDQIFRQCAAVDRHERHFGPQALIVHRPGDQFLARAGFAEDQHGRVGRRNLGDQPADLLHFLRIADQIRRAFEPFQPLLERPILVGQFAFFGHAQEHGLQIDQLAGLGEIIEHALPKRGNGRFQRRLAGEDDGLGVGRKLLRPGDHVDAVQTRHVEIDEDAVVGVPFQRGHGGGAVGADRDLVSHSRQFQTHYFLQRFFVVGKQQFQSFRRLGGDDRSPYMIPVVID